MEIVPFTDEHLDAAAELLAARHQAQRRVFPALPEADYRAEIASLLEQEATGVFTEGAYILGRSGPADRWGPNVWVDAAGHAATEPEQMRDVWGAAAEQWLAAGLRAHYALVPASDEPLLDAWFRLGFGAQQAHGIIDIPERTWPAGTREATEDDLEALVELAPFLSRHQQQSPVFSGVPEASEAEIRASIEEDYGRDDIGNLVYELDCRIVGNFEVCPLELSNAHTGLARPPGVSFLGFAVTHPDVRGSGAGLALTDASFAWAREHGYEVMVTDWRVTNLPSSRFWPRRGFRTSFLRLHRWIGAI